MSISRARIDEAMQGHDFFGGVREETRCALANLGEIRTVEAETVLFHHGGSYKGFYLMVEGTVHLYRLSPEGRMLVLHVIRPGESFAEVPLFEAEEHPSYPATAETLEDSTFLFFPADPFLSFIDEHPRSALHMLGQMAKRLRKTVRQLDAVSLQDVQERLARHLVKQVPTVPDDPDTPPTVEIDIPKSILAAELGTVPETLSRALRSLEEKNLIRSEASQIALTDIKGLRNITYKK